VHGMGAGIVNSSLCDAYMGRVVDEWKGGMDQAVLWSLEKKEGSLLSR